MSNSKSYVAGLFALLALAIVSQSCTKGFEELNVNPNEPTEVNPEFLFTESIVKSFEDDVVGVETELNGLMTWSQIIASPIGINSSSEQYVYSGSSNNKIWDRWHVGVLSNLQSIINQTKDDPNLVNKHAVARIWKAYMYQKITDLWGDIPYSEALQGSAETPIFAPKYDSQDQIYYDLLNELKSAVAAIDMDKDDFGAADPLFQGDLEAWKRFANSLRLRMSLRISNVAQGVAQEHITALMNEDNFISSNTESASFPYMPGTRSPIVEFFTRYEHFMKRPSHYFVELLKASNDPRLGVFADSTGFSQIIPFNPYVGVPNDKTSVELNTLGLDDFNTSELGGWFLTETTPGNTLSYAEVCFLKAEVALKGWGGSQTAQQYYDEGVTASMEAFGVDPTEISNYLSGLGAFDGTLEDIITEKWITFAYRDGFEAFAELRRTGFPVLTNFDGSAVSMSLFPQRLPYPDSEISLNGSNVSAVGVGIGEMQTKMWWAN